MRHKIKKDKIDLVIKHTYPDLLYQRFRILLTGQEPVKVMMIFCSYLHSLFEQATLSFFAYSIRLLHFGHNCPVGFDQSANLQSG